MVLTLCGVLKDILLVVASVVFRSEPVTGLQVFGYSIALAGLIYFKLGAETLKAKFSDAGRAWADYGVRHPALRKVIVFVGMLLLAIIVLVGLAPSVGYGFQVSQLSGWPKRQGKLSNFAVCSAGFT